MKTTRCLFIKGQEITVFSYSDNIIFEDEVGMGEDVGQSSRFICLRNDITIFIRICNPRGITLPRKDWISCVLVLDNTEFVIVD